MRPPLTQHAGDFRAVYAGGRHSCVLGSEKAYCWGDNGSHQLGTGGTESQELPQQLEQPWDALTLGKRHSCGLNPDGEVWCWGEGGEGQLGQGDQEDRDKPSRVPLPAAATQISADSDHSCARLTDGRLYCWGEGSHGQLGQGNDNGSSTPVALAGDDWSFVDTGDGHTCAIRTDGSLWCWGRNSQFQSANVEERRVRRPRQVGTLQGWQRVEAGGQHTCAILEDGSMWCWGFTAVGEPLRGPPRDLKGLLSQDPTQIRAEEQWIDLATNAFHTCAINSRAELWCWGRNADGQLGLGDGRTHNNPTIVGSGYLAVAVGRFHTCAIHQDNGVECAGQNDLGQLGVGDREHRPALAPIQWE